MSPVRKLFFFVLIQLCAVSALLQSATYTAPCASSAPSINGSLADSAWTSPPYQGLSNCGGSCPLLGTQSAQFKVTWDATYLYIAADVNDPYVSKTQANPWERSGVEVWFDFNNSNEGSMQAADWQFIFTWDGSSTNAYRNGGAVGTPAGISASGVTKSGGYTLELRFTWASINGTAPTPGTTVSGINVQADFPSSLGGNRDRWVSWSSSNNNPGSWNDLAYSACGATPTPTPTALSCGSPSCSGSWTVIGNGSTIANGVHLTDAATWQSTAMWSNFKLDLSSAFNAQYDLYFGNNDGGADGITFVMHNDPRGLAAQGDNGAGLTYADTTGGYSPITPSLAVEFDTYQNTAGPNFNDPAYDHASIHLNGNGDEASVPVAYVQADAGDANIEDGAWHRVQISWDPVADQLRVYFDGVLRLTYNSDIIATVFGGVSCVYWGFTSATGDATNVHEAREVACYSPTPTFTRTQTTGPSPTRTASRTITRTHTHSPTLTQTPSFTPAPTSPPAGCGAPSFVRAKNVSYDATGSGCYNAGNSFSYDSGPAAANRLLIIRIEQQNNVSPTLVWYGGTTLTALMSNNHYGGGRILTYYMTAPPTGANTLTVNYAAGGCNHNVVAEVYSDVNQSAPFGGTRFATGSGDPLSLTVTASSALSILSNFMVLAQVQSGGVISSRGAGQVSLGVTTACCEEITADYRPSGGTGTQAMTYDLNMVKNYSAQIVEIMPLICTPTPTPMASSPTATPTRTISRSPTFTRSPTPSPSPTPTPNMQLTKTVNRSQAMLGDTITFTLRWANPSSGSVDMELWDTLHPALTYLGCSNGCANSGRYVAWDLGPQASGSTGQVLVWARITGLP